MKKIFVILVSIFILVSCNNTQNSNEKNSTNNNQKLQEQKVTKQNILEKEDVKEVVQNKKITKEDYGDLKDFIDPALDPEEQGKVLEILEQRKQRQKEIQKIFNDILENGGFDEKFSEIEKMRTTCMQRILPYVKEDKKEEFIKMCENGNEKLKILYYKNLSKKNK